MHKLINFYLFYGQQGSVDNSAAMLTSLLIGGQMDRCSIPSRSKKCILLWSLQTCSGAHPQSKSRVLSPEAKRLQPEADHSPHLVPQLRIIVLYFHSVLAFGGLCTDKFISAITQTVKWWDVLGIAHWISGRNRVVSFPCCISTSSLVRTAS